MAEDIKQEMNSTPGCIPSKWNRNTVADGDWLQKYTLAPLSSRDNFLADKISGTEFNLDEEIKARIAGDKYLSATIESVSSDFYTFSGNVCASAENLSAALKEEIRIRGEQDYNLSQQIIGEKSQRIDADNKLQKEIDKLEAATDVIMVYADYNEFTIGSAYLVEEDYLTDADVIKVLQDETSGSKQIYYQWYDPASAHEWSGWSAIGSLEPYYSIADMDRILADTVDNLSATVSSNYLSANGTAVQSGHNIVISAHPTSPYIKIETSSHVTFDGVSSTNLSATNASGTSAIFSGVSGTTVLGKTVSGTSGIFTSGKIDTANILTAYGNSAKYDNISATNLTADTVKFGTANFDDIIAKNISATAISSTNLTALTATGNSAKFTNISATNISADLFKSDLGTVDTCNLNFISAIGDTLTTNKGNIINLSATTLYGQSNNSNVDSLIGSAQSGKFAWNVINSAKFSAINSTTSTAFLSGGFGISAGNNLDLTFANNIIKLNAKDTGITAISAGGNGGGKKYTGPTFSASAGTGITFVTGSNDNLGIRASDGLLGSAYSGAAASSLLATQSATLSAGSGINFISAGENTLGIAVNYSTVTENGVNYVTALNGTALSAGMKYSDGNCIEVNNSTKQINLSSDLDVRSIVLSGDTVDPGDISMDLDYRYLSGTNHQSIPNTFYINPYYINYKTPLPNLAPANVWIDGLGVSATGPGIGNTTATTWAQILSASTGNYVNANGNEVITLSTALPSNTANMVNGVIYLV